MFVGEAVEGVIVGIHVEGVDVVDGTGVVEGEDVGFSDIIDTVRISLLPFSDT